MNYDPHDGLEPATPADSYQAAQKIAYAHSSEISADDLDLGNVDEHGNKIHRKRKRLYCFSCNRPEGHSLWKQHFWYYSFLSGLTFGVVKLFGPFQCQCCGHRRLMSVDLLSPRYLYRSFVLRKAGGGRKTGGGSRKGKKTSEPKFRATKWK